MDDNIIKFKRKPRALRKTYDPTMPYEVERVDQEDGSISFHVVDVRPDSYRDVCVTNDAYGNGYAKHDAEQIALGLNMLVSYGKEKLPNVKSADDADLDCDDDE